MDSKKEKKSVFKRWWFWVIVIIVLIAAGSAAGGGDSAPTGGGNTNNAADKKDEEKTEFAVNEKATFDDKSITVTEVQRNYDTGNQFSQPESGKEFVIVTVAITNDGDGTLDYNTFNFKLQDSNGVQQNEAFSALSEGKLNSGSLAAGGKVSGKLAYEVPKDDAGLKLLYQDFSFFDNKAITFKLQ